MIEAISYEKSGKVSKMVCGMTLYQILWYFMIYSVIGWMIEVSYHAITLGKVVNRGFLNGPVCPVYGSGVLMVLFVLFIDGQLFGFETDLQKASTLGLFVVGIIFAPLLSDWDCDYYDELNGKRRYVKGEWIFRRVLEGAGIQDIFIFPS